MMSMTAYANLEKNKGPYRVTCEIKSINSRYIDISADMPRYLNPFEAQIKSILTTKIKRGKVYISINITTDKLSYIDTKLAKKYVLSLQTICKQTNIKDDVRISDLIMINSLLKSDDEPNDKEKLFTDIIIPLFNATVDRLAKERQREGNKTKDNISYLVKKINVNISSIKEYEPSNKQKSIEKMKANIGSYTKGISEDIDEQRLLTEIAILSSKIDINEELERLLYHTDEFNTLMSNDTLLVGKKLEFLSQEMLRETNTIASKSNDIRITSLSVDIKSIIEQIKEQIRNIE